MPEVKVITDVEIHLTTEELLARIAKIIRMIDVEPVE